MTYLFTFDNTIVTGSDDGFVNSFNLDKNKLSLLKSRNVGRIITGIFKLNKNIYYSVYESF